MMPTRRSNLLSSVARRCAIKLAAPVSSTLGIMKMTNWKNSYRYLLCVTAVTTKRMNANNESWLV